MPFRTWKSYWAVMLAFHFGEKFKGVPMKLKQPVATAVLTPATGAPGTTARGTKKKKQATDKNPNGTGPPIPVPGPYSLAGTMPRLEFLTAGRAAGPAGGGGGGAPRAPAAG